MELLKLPIPLPSVDFESEVVGVCEVLQQIPRAETAAPPSLKTVPPPDAVVEVNAAKVAVETTGNRAGTEIVSWLP